MTLRERIALGAALIGFAAITAGVAGEFGPWWGCVAAGVLLVAASVALGLGDPAELAGEPELADEGDEGDEDWHVYKIRGTDDAGQGPTGGGR